MSEDIVSRLRGDTMAAVEWTAKCPVMCIEAADEIERLRAEVNLLRGADLAGENVRLRAEIEVLRKDAERYRWLRVTREEQMPNGTFLDVFDDDNTLLFAHALDAVIDAAMAKEKP